MDQAIIGIDLGTTNISCFYIKNQRIEQLQMADGSGYFPSKVMYKEKGKAILLHTKSLIPTRARNVVGNYKLIVGKTIDEAIIKEFKKKYNICLEEREGETGFRIELNSKNSFIKTPNEVCSDVLREILKLAGEKMGRTSFDTVCLTVPAAFDQNQIKALHNILREVNIPNSVIVSEPVAAAIAYGNSVDGQGDGIYLIFDYGGGTFDSAVVEKKEESYTVLSKGGINKIGGTAIDLEIANEILYSIVSKTNRRAIQKYYANDRNFNKLLSLVEDAKIALSSGQEAEIELDWRDDDDDDDEEDEDNQVVINRLDIERAIKSYVDKAIGIMINTIGDSGKSLDEIDHVVMVGGTSQIPYIRQRIFELFPKEKVCINLNPMTVVGEGACIVAKWYSEGGGCDQSKDFSYYNEEEEEKKRKEKEERDGKHRFKLKKSDKNGNVNAWPYVDCLFGPIAIRSDDDESFFLFPKNSNYGNQKIIQIGTTYDGQDIIYLDFCQGESRSFSNNTYLGRLEYQIEDKDENGVRIHYKAGEGVFILTCVLDSQGLLKCEIQSQQTGEIKVMELDTKKIEMKDDDDKQGKCEKKMEQMEMKDGNDKQDKHVEEKEEEDISKLEDRYQQLMKELRKKRIDFMYTDKYSSIVYDMNDISKKKKEMKKDDVYVLRSLVNDLSKIKSQYF